MRARLDEYSGFHRTAGNEACHYVGVPIIIAGAGTLLGRVALFGVAGFRVTLTEVVLALIALFYLVEARWLGLATALVMVALAELARPLELWVGLALFLGGWAVQFVGHALFEHRSPAFLGNLLHLLVGPAWLLERAAKPKSAP
ncbi:MAG: DUF962 domain-containing protein [Polyangiaceae bacterium]